MLKKSAVRRIMVSTLALIIVGLLYFFPNDDENIIKQSISYIDVANTPIYLLNNDDLVIRTTIVTNSNDTLDLAKELINSLIIGNEKKDYIPNSFKQIIPANAKILEISLNDGLLKINFSKELLNVAKNDEEKMIEAIVFTLTEIDEIKQIMIFVENTKLDTLPQSNIKLPNTLDRSIGINKVYDITNIKDLNKTTIYYIGKENDLSYYIPVTKIDNNNDDKVKIIIDELKSSPIYQTNLISYLASNTELLNYELLENQITLSFNNAIFSDLNEKNILEEVKYSISLSLKDSIMVDEVIFKVDDEIIETFKSIN